MVLVLPVEDSQLLGEFNNLVRTEQIPSKERVVFVENPPDENVEKFIRECFNGRNSMNRFLLTK